VAAVGKMILKLRHVFQRPYVFSACALMRFKRHTSSLPEVRNQDVFLFSQVLVLVSETKLNEI